jgi:hypothetical protein
MFCSLLETILMLSGVCLELRQLWLTLFFVGLSFGVELGWSSGRI